jgi:hypothetical protein
MYLSEFSQSDVPTFVTMASAGHSIVAFGHVDDFASALVWCGRAMQEFARAEQVAIGRPAYVEWAGIGRVFAVLPSQGWIRSLDGWHRAEERELQRFFDHVPAEPCIFAVEEAPVTAVRPRRVRETPSVAHPQAPARAFGRESLRTHSEPERSLKVGG